MEYDASHKASSVTSTTSNSSIWDPLPSLYTGRADSVSSAYDELPEPEPIEGKPTKIDFSLEFPSSHGKRRLEEEENRELLSDDQKRANHIASEQKRRNTIRGGFKELTEIIPTLKNINNSKSTILFKSVDYIKQLDKRNKSLRERLSLLQQQRKKPITHKKQVQLLQEQLRAQQELLTRHNIHSIPLYTTHSSISIPAMDDTPVTSTTNSPTMPHASLPTVNIHHHQFHQQQQQNTYQTSAALVIPADDWSHSNAPSFNIPADDHHHHHHYPQHSFRERLLSSGKLNHLRKDVL
ncbi:uncharacterized protein EV154DRAFT_460784 [Mucor mucedo]|uniref:uncharacterized protein n=1 Tax=Mucor mucedo TaxID=29922 RepID=UPI002220770C|nr:uncharacterized protein EV154DRAFT_460784 [Mucor mucedo]KAI7893686.1 hypothetical protein EV154DRAFT_460784 [Mucor mucedo]